MRTFIASLCAGVLLASCAQEFDAGPSAQKSQIPTPGLAQAELSVTASPLQMVDRSDRKINEISFPCTHNSYNDDSGVFDNGNVSQGMPTQFARGIRAVEVDIHERRSWFKKNVSVYHGKISNGINGSRLAHYVLREVTDFVEDNPDEIVFLKLETTVSASKLDKEIRKAGLDKHVFVRDPQNPYPTKAEVVASGKRVVFTRQIDGSQYGESLDRHKHGSGETDKEDHTPQASPSDKRFFAFNYYSITSLFGYGDKDAAKYLNNPSRLAPFADDVWKLNGKKPWCLTVDYPSVHNGHYYDVIEALNEKGMLKGQILDSDGDLLMKNNGSVITWTWQCQYSDETVTAKTSADFSFPMKESETVTITPVSDTYNFTPASLTVTNGNVQDVFQAFTATPK
ncbi:hypothetical protein FUAX_10560 [Fulvitalea axinellae]|uniref:Phosphatidylinositol diacylglycerol-lyase n=1 Tax=Fulvitalea axinellae TaxID=1182444 RepID=A0AAU9C9C4_9BACT|nr:hypothetical protein FUAX_10560 [Fulvitalea axinellae]